MTALTLLLLAWRGGLGRGESIVAADAYILFVAVQSCNWPSPIHENIGYTDR